MTLDRFLTMKLISLAVLITVVAGRPQFPPHPARGFPPGPPGHFVPIISQNFDLTPDGTYNFHYESADGSRRQEQGFLKNPGTPFEGQAVTGSYSYIAPDGTPVTVTYIADENGFQPQGTHIHPQIQRAAAAGGYHPGAFGAGFPGQGGPFGGK